MKKAPQENSKDQSAVCLNDSTLEKFSQFAKIYSKGIVKENVNIEYKAMFPILKSSIT